MRFGRIGYRTRQLWHALQAAPEPEDLERVRSILSPSLWALFTRQSRGEQAHSINVMKKLLERGETHPDLLTAALLHDVGKSCWPLRLWERVIIVLGSQFFISESKRWAHKFPAPPPPQDRRTINMLQKPFVIAEQHPVWGANLVAEAGARSLTVALIRRHQETVHNGALSEEDRLLIKLQSVDDES
jgi:hypothetical protein